MSPAIRLQKILSTAGVASRRAAERLIENRRVTVNGVTVARLGARADPTQDDIRVDGKRVSAPARRTYLLINKPRGYVTTRRDPLGRPTILDLVPGLREYVYPVGRLDWDSEGLIILTNDGELAARLMHPRHGIERVYEARVRGVPDAAALHRLARGVAIDGRRTSPAAARLLDVRRTATGAQAVVAITLREGRNRQVRKMCEAVGHPVVRLRRVRIGPIADAELRPGQCRALTRREIDALRTGGGARSEAPPLSGPARPGRPPAPPDRRRAAPPRVPDR